jgi:hypothetical protein
MQANILQRILALIAASSLAAIGSSYQSSATRSSGAAASAVVSKGIDVFVNYYLSVAFSDGLASLKVSVADGGKTGTYDSNSPSFTIVTNFAASVSTSITSTAIPGLWSAQVSQNGLTWLSGPNAYTVSSGSSNNFLRAHVSNLNLTNATPGSYSGLVTLTISHL